MIIYSNSPHELVADIVVSSESVGIDVFVLDITRTQTGPEAGGRDQAAKFAPFDTIYIYSITGASVPLAAIASKSSVAPALPPGYDTVDDRLFSLVLDAAGLIRTLTLLDKRVYFENELAETAVLTGGAVINSAPVVEVDCSKVVPEEATIIHFLVRSFGGQVRLGNISGRASVVSSNDCITFDAVTARSGRKIYYANTAAGTTVNVWVTGYDIP